MGQYYFLVGPNFLKIHVRQNRDSQGNN